MCPARPRRNANHSHLGAPKLYHKPLERVKKPIFYVWYPNNAVV